ncbi:MAG: N utilization substance protein B-like protein [Candidatus Roizmanbacteria bacterium GW2011_GWC2_37_13]|uniref:N utilization substance protein B-like protein n=1 Tax=Candidatus Roizmanbacteria bacterium GW2011_GWC2_37_13 TaxID=1618486 RepID=A0A0G0GHX4_9BACT|nr:MAG: N utilization substance protein B-like protein [Candidatus Roizmanbacteria bacterium GW2011_GWC1_37_12]KKQ25690.1 MAG: N utilization substance protein B-like protein [Candidatus Roizmanbacteria bacterium GW2011_GWC2_37_13]
MDPRHKLRLKIVQELYSTLFTNPTNLTNKTNLILKALPTLDDLVKKHAPKFPLEKIAKVDLAILRLAIFELTVEKKEPAKVIINEAVELAKDLGSEKSFAFVNAVLGKIYDSKT